VLGADQRHPRELANDAVGRFLQHVGQTEKDPLRCMVQAHEALSFLYQGQSGTGQSGTFLVVH
jgi:hypothetical protein